MTDGELIKLIRQISHWIDHTVELMDRLSEHSNGNALREALQENGLEYSVDCLGVAHDHLQVPGRWEYDQHRRTLTWRRQSTAAEQ